MTGRIRRLGLILGVGFCLLLAALTRLQVVDASKLASDPRNTRVLTAAFSAERGLIQTADGVVLAKSVASADQFKRQRQYPEGELYASLTGYLSFTYGADGAERAFNSDLVGGGLPGGDKSLRDLFNGGNKKTEDVTLTVVSAVQKAAASALGNRRGSVVALDPTNGAILAMVNFPTFDPNPLAAHTQENVRNAWDELQNNPGKPLLPRAYRESYAPGSTFKVVTASAAFDRAPELTTKAYPSLRQLDLPRTDKDLPNFGGSSCGGTISDLLRVSCNTGFAQMGLDLGGPNLAAEAGAFGFGERPPLDLPAAAVSHFPDPGEFERNEPGLAFSAIGQQNVTATPLQMALVAAAIANNGVIMSPHVLKEISDEKRNIVKSYDPKEWRKATSPETAAAVKAMMVDVAARGTATRAGVNGVTVAAKTGTAQTVGNNAHAWLIAFA
ncbi:MAG: penicillin-binding protein 2, partial [Actinobacteria bacterium]|nr:penicillin-binding protein 2 [Actinomycetota bacterium]